MDLDVPSRSIVYIPKFSGEDKENIMEWLELWNRAVMANGWSIDVEMVMFPLYLFGRALQYFRTLPTEVKGNVYEIKQQFEKHFNSPSQRLMDLVLTGLNWSHCLVYLDDIIISFGNCRRFLF